MPDRAEIGDEEPEMSLVMPFVVCASNGGPYDDQAFVAGVVFAQHQALLEHAHPEDGRTVVTTFPVYPALVPQLDLLAMAHGYRLHSEPVPGAAGEWTSVSYRPGEPSPGDTE